MDGLTPEVVGHELNNKINIDLLILETNEYVKSCLDINVSSGIFLFL